MVIISGFSAVDSEESGVIAEIPRRVLGVFCHRGARVDRMPPKKAPAPSKKAEQKKKEKVIEV